MINFCARYVEPRIIIRRVPRGTRGALVTARLIAQLVREGAKDFYVRQKAIEIFRAYGARPKDRFGEICALFDWVRRNIRYTRDIFQVELLHTARRMLELKAGDCDDMTILLGAMQNRHVVAIARLQFEHPSGRVQQLDLENVARVADVAPDPIEESADFAEAIFGTRAVSAEDLDRLLPHVKIFRALADQLRD